MPLELRPEDGTEGFSVSGTAELIDLDLNSEPGADQRRSGTNYEGMKVKAAPRPPSKLWKPCRISTLMAQAAMARPVSPPAERSRTAKGSIGRFLSRRRRTAETVEKPEKRSGKPAAAAAEDGVRKAEDKSKSTLS